MTRNLSAAGLLGAILLVAGCATPLANLRQRQQLATPSGRFVVHSAVEDAGSDEIVEQALQDVGPKLARWGGLREPVRVHVLPDHAQLEQAVNKTGYAWLRAWARYDEVFVQSPRTWSFFGATQREVNEVLLHELVHCVMYQQAGDLTTWRRKQIPTWFREGMASFSADQGYRWPTLEDLARFYAEHPSVDPVQATDGMYRGQSDIVYGAAHHAFSFLVKRYGEEGVRRVLASMSAGQPFPKAFEEGIGIPPGTFVNDFKRYVRWRGFRGGRLRMPIAQDAMAPAEPSPAAAHPETPPAPVGPSAPAGSTSPPSPATTTSEPR